MKHSSLLTRPCCDCAIFVAAGDAGAGTARSSEDDGQEDIIDAADAPGGYSAAYAKLANASMPERPVLSEIPDPKQFAERELAKFMSRMGSA